MINSSNFFRLEPDFFVALISSKFLQISMFWKKKNQKKLKLWILIFLTSPSHTRIEISKIFLNQTSEIFFLRGRGAFLVVIESHSSETLGDHSTPGFIDNEIDCNSPIYPLAAIRKNWHINNFNKLEQNLKYGQKLRWFLKFDMKKWEVQYFY